MREIITITKAYTFEELPPEAKEKAIGNLYYINVEYGWWQYGYEDAENIGMKITEFDLDRGNYLKAEFTLYPLKICEEIFKEHGEDTDTFRIASTFMEKWSPVYADYLDENSENYESEESEGLLMELEEEFHRDLRGAYLSMLRQEYEYLTSEEAIIETIQANEYEFTEKGKLI
jgi:hypothetical protein